MGEELLIGRNLVKKFAGAGDACALNDVSISVKRGTLVIIKGRSGSGKTTLLNVLGTLDMPTAGEVEFDRKVVSGMDERSTCEIRRHEMGFVFQSVALTPAMTAYENVDFALRLAGYEGNRDERVKECLAMVGLAGRMSHMSGQLSGGEQQRVAIARAIAHEPKIIFADEPTGALDTAAGMAVVALFRKHVDEEGATVVMTTHDPGLMEMGDEVYEMVDGKIVGARAVM